MNNLSTKISTTGAILMALSIALGAFGAHGLERMVNPQALDTFEVGVRYQVYHSLAIVVIGLSGRLSDSVKKRTFILWMLGVVLFSGSLYLLATSEVIGEDLKFLGPVTPIGGLALIAGWGYLAFGLWKNR
ncbi:DUF423 domain-containing protein [Aureitalea marina]|uniref:DUF423 domain-containing protein n=1 Tax=Aureitalea marina TaxID=930804 RepID=A0A2S7KT68_9FLAO|nr:DUF423 domain-containing protein [Aureitalea marina]PQB05824.1 hypothetical protein BST85_13645 [Aureitalea marina]